MTELSPARARLRWGAAITVAAVALSGLFVAAPASAAPITYGIEDTTPVDAPAVETPAVPVEAAPIESPAPETPAPDTPAPEAPAPEAPTGALPATEAPVPTPDATEPPADEFARASGETSLELDAAPDALAIAATPTITVSPATGLDREGDTVSITGSGYDPTKAIYVAICENRDLSTVTFDMFYGCVGSRLVSPNPTSDTQVKLNADGTFSFELAVPASATAFASAAVFTIRNHIAPTDRTQDAKFGIAFAPIPPPPAPSITVTPSTELNRTGDTVTVTGANYDPTKAIYVAICADRDLATVTFDMFYGCVGSKLVSPNPTSDTQVKLNADGTFSFELAVPASATAFASAAVFTIRNHIAPTDRTQDAKAAIAFAAPVIPKPTITVTPSTDLDRAGDTVTVAGANYDPAKAIYVAICADRDLATVTFDMFYGCVGSRLVSPNPTSDTQVKLNADGTFSFELAVPASATAFASAAVFTIRNHIAPTDRTQDAKAAIAFAPVPAPVPTLTVTPSTALDRAGDTVTVSGTGYDPTKAVYVAICEDRDLSTVTFDMFYGCVGSRLISPNPTSDTQVKLNADGTFSFELDVPATAAAYAHPAVFTIRNHAAPTDRTQDARAGIAFAAIVDPTDPTGPIDPGNPTNPGAPSGPSVGLSVSPNAVNAASANTFSISGSGYTGAGAANGVYVSIGSSAVWQPGQVPSQSGWLQTVWVQPGSIVNGGFSVSITIPAGSFQTGTSYGVATFAAHQLSLTNRTLDAWAPISLGAAASTSSTAVQPGSVTPPATPPATEGITQVGSDALTEGESSSFTAAGFQPNETGILVVIYSTPTVLDRNATADANGVVTWTGTLPYGLTGEHTLTFQGSVTRGLVVDIAEAAQVGCPVDDAALTWGFKESFRSYISGTIANGEWTVADGATYETPSFGWSDGSGSYDADTFEGLLSFDGSITFTGHSGALNTTVSSPRIEFVDAETAVLLLDVSGTTQEGAPIDLTGVEFATIDVAGAEVVDGQFVLTDATVTLAADGAAAFGTYPEGEALDPIALAFSVDAACVTAASADVTTTEAVEPASSTADFWWLLWVLAGLLVVALAAWLVISRRRVVE